MTVTDAPPVDGQNAAAADALADIPSPTAAPTDNSSGKARRRSSPRSTSGKRKPAADKAPTSKPRGRPFQPSLDKRLSSGIDSLGQLVELVEPFDGAVLRHNSGKLGAALAELAKDRPAVRRAMESLLSMGDNAGAVGVIVGVALPIVAHHGLVPGQAGAMLPVVAQMLGTMPDVDASAPSPLAGVFAMADQMVAAERAAGSDDGLAASA